MFPSFQARPLTYPLTTSHESLMTQTVSRHPVAKAAIAKTQIDWVEIERAYQTDRKVAEIATQYGLTRQVLVATAKAKQWTLRKDRGKQAEKRPHRKGDGKKSVTSAALRVRLTRLVERQIHEIEDQIETVGSGADRERAARTLSNLTRTLEKLVELRRAARQERQARQRDLEQAKSKKAGVNGTEHRNIRRELERRLARLSTGNRAAEVSGEPQP